MPNKYLRISIPLIMALALTACGADSGVSTDDLNATRAAALTEIELTAAFTLLPSASPSPSPTKDLGPTLTPTPAPSHTATRPAGTSGPLCDDSVYVADVTIPDGTVIDPGDTFTKTWSLRNTGACSWTTAYALDYSSGSRMDGVITYLTDSVDPGEEVEISIGLAAPTTPGTHTGYWRMKNADGVFFGQFIYVQIVVPGDATVTSEPEATEPVPTATETETPTPEE